MTFSNYISIIILSVIATYSSVAQKKTFYKSKYFKTYSTNHKTIAIIPVIGTFNFTDNTYSNKEDKKLKYTQAKQVQKLMESYFNERKNKKSFSVIIQDTDTTNTILEKNGITYNSIKVHTVKEIATLLKVDAIISGILDIDAPFQDNSIPFFNFDSKNVRMSIKISDGKSRKLLWKYEKMLSYRNKKNVKSLIINFVKQASKDFPYKK